MGVVTLDSTTTYANLIPQYYERQLLEVFRKKTRFYNFGTKNALETNNGKTVTWNRFTTLDEGYVLTEGVNPSNQSLATTKVSALIRQFGGVAAFSDFADLTTINDMGEAAITELADSAARTIDSVVQEEIITHTAPGSVQFYIKMSAQVYYSTAATAPSVVSGGSKMAVSDIRAVAFKLRGWDVPALQGQDYVAITSPQVVETLESDTSWQNYHIYTEKGIDNVYTGEVGRIFGTRFFTTTNVRVSAGSSTGAANVQLDAPSAGREEALVHSTFVFGRGFYGITELDGGIKYFSHTAATKSDPLNVQRLYGWKANFITKVLNVSAGIVMWTGVDSAALGCLTSARKANGLRFGYPSTAT